MIQKMWTGQSVPKRTVQCNNYILKWQAGSANCKEDSQVLTMSFANDPDDLSGPTCCKEDGQGYIAVLEKVERNDFVLQMMIWII